MRESCGEHVGGSPGCATYCTKVKNHLGECEWNATAQVLWNQIAEYEDALLLIRNQGTGSWANGHGFMGATGKPWRHWAQIAAEVLTTGPAQEQGPDA